MVQVKVSNHPLIRHKLTLLRSVETGPKKFREVIREVAILLAYEATADLGAREVAVETPLATTTGLELTDKIGLVPILRAGLGMVEGIWEMMPTAEVWHIGLYRDHQTLAAYPSIRPGLPDPRSHAGHRRFSGGHSGHPETVGSPPHKVCRHYRCARGSGAFGQGSPGRRYPPRSTG
jgi:hypothetical protein